MNRKEYGESSLERDGKSSSCFCFDWFQFLKPHKNKQKSYERILNKIDEPAKRTDITLDNQTSADNFRSNALEIETFESRKLIEIKSQNDRYSLLIKITQHKFSKSFEKNPSSNIDLKNLHFQKALDEELLNLLAGYLATRIKCEFLADFSGDNDQLSFAFAKQSQFTIKFLNDLQTFQKYSKSSLKKSAEFLYIDDLCANFRLKRKIDTCFLDPNILHFSRNLLDKNFIDFLKIWYPSCENLIMILPPDITNIIDLAESFNLTLPKKARCSIEIEKIYLDDDLKFLIIYYGNKSKVTEEEELDFLCRKLTSKDSYEPETLREIRKSLTSLERKVGNLLLLKFINESLSQNSKLNVTSYGYLIDFLLHRRISFSSNEYLNFCRSEKSLSSPSVGLHKPSLFSSQDKSKGKEEEDYYLEFSDYSIDLNDEESKEEGSEIRKRKANSNPRKHNDNFYVTSLEVIDFGSDSESQQKKIEHRYTTIH